MKILIAGACSAIAQAAARRFAAEKNSFFLAARNEERLQVLAEDLKVRGAAQVETGFFDAQDFESHTAVVREAHRSLGGLDGVLIAHGMAGDQEACERDYALAEQVFRTNFLSVVSLLTLLVPEFEKHKAGFIAVISSVAADRGRQSNYIYGASKSALDIYLGGLRNRLHDEGIQVLTIKPGFVATPMTAHLPKNVLFADPEDVGRAIYDAIIQKKDVVYLPWFWQWIMLAIKLMPECLFKRLKL